jgi:hypothetical protein
MIAKSLTGEKVYYDDDDDDDVLYKKSAISC